MHVYVFFRLKDDRKLEDSDNISVTWDAETRLASLVFKSIKLEDSGKYSCIAYSDVGGHALSSTVMQVRGEMKKQNRVFLCWY